MHTFLVGTLRLWLVKNENSKFVCVYKGSVLWTEGVYHSMYLSLGCKICFVVDASGLCPQWMSCGWIYMYMILSDHLFFYFIFSFPSQIVNRGFTDLSVESEKGSGFLQDHLPLYILLSSFCVTLSLNTPSSLSCKWTDMYYFGEMVLEQNIDKNFFRPVGLFLSRAFVYFFI